MPAPAPLSSSCPARPTPQLPTGGQEMLHPVGGASPARLLGAGTHNHGRATPLPACSRRDRVATLPQPLRAGGSSARRNARRPAPGAASHPARPPAPAPPPHRHACRPHPAPAVVRGRWTHSHRVPAGGGGAAAAPAWRAGRERRGAAVQASSTHGSTGTPRGGGGLHGCACLDGRRCCSGSWQAGAGGEGSGSWRQGGRRLATCGMQASASHRIPAGGFTAV
jgi:hypothetical protein